MNNFSAFNLSYQLRYNCVFHKHANSKVQKPPSQLGFSLPSIIITITSNEPGNTETHKTDRNPLITNHKPWPFEPVKVKVCFLRGPLRWLTAPKNRQLQAFELQNSHVCEKRSNGDDEHSILIMKRFINDVLLCYMKGRTNWFIDWYYLL